MVQNIFSTNYCPSPSSQIFYSEEIIDDSKVLPQPYRNLLTFQNRSQAQVSKTETEAGQDRGSSLDDISLTPRL